VNSVTSARPNSAGPISHLDEFDGLRGLAVLGVMLFHSTDQLNGTILGPIARQGWAGVNLFFVLSGFLISLILIRTRAQPRFFTNFYARRALRIWPLYFALLIGSWLLAFSTPHAAVSKSILQTPWVPYALLIQNLVLSSMPGPLLPTWTLAIEEQFYLAWAPIVRFLGTRYAFGIALAIIIISPATRFAVGDQLLSTNTLLNLDGLALGALLALLFDQDQLTHRLGWSLVVGGAAGLSYLHFDPSPLLPTFCASAFGGILTLLLAAPSRYRAFRSMLRVQWLVGLGVISYGLYLLHGWTYILLSTIGLDRYLAQLGTLGDLGIVAARVAATVLIALLSWTMLERPALSLKRLFPTSNRRPHQP
jgi:peptidoglycan/LPS O-acetylase OafA/YrhL